MSDLRRVALDLGLANVRTFNASGNLLFDSDLPEAALKSLLEAAVSGQVGKAVTTMIRSGEELAAVARSNPFAAHDGSKVAAIFLDAAPSVAALTEHRNKADEVIALGLREIYVFYPRGMGQSRLVIPAAKAGTARNLNTVARLAELCGVA
jgi:uncharacterized protein (DUF1697 family)